MYQHVLPMVPPQAQIPTARPKGLIPLIILHALCTCTAFIAGAIATSRVPSISSSSNLDYYDVKWYSSAGIWTGAIGALVVCLGIALICWPSLSLRRAYKSISIFAIFALCVPLFFSGGLAIVSSFDYETDTWYVSNDPSYWIATWFAAVATLFLAIFLIISSCVTCCAYDPTGCCYACCMNQICCCDCSADQDMMMRREMATDNVAYIEIPATRIAVRVVFDSHIMNAMTALNGQATYLPMNGNALPENETIDNDAGQHAQSNSVQHNTRFEQHIALRTTDILEKHVVKGTDAMVAQSEAFGAGAQAQQIMASAQAEVIKLVAPADNRSNNNASNAPERTGTHSGTAAKVDMFDSLANAASTMAAGNEVLVRRVVSSTDETTGGKTMTRTETVMEATTSGDNFATVGEKAEAMKAAMSAISSISNTQMSLLAKEAAKSGDKLSNSSDLPQSKEQPDPSKYVLEPIFGVYRM